MTPFFLEDLFGDNIDAGYKKLAKVAHPDAGGDPDNFVALTRMKSLASRRQEAGVYGQRLVPGEERILKLVSPKGDIDIVERLANPVQVKHFEKLTGQAAENRTMASLLNALQTKWDVFVIRPGGTSCFGMATVRDRWRAVLPVERVIDVEDWHDINGLIAGTASIVGGASLDTTVDNLKSAGISTDGITTALAQIASSTELAGRVDEEPSEAARI